jgi:dTDP-glucose pyrophosphorylase
MSYSEQLPTAESWKKALLSLNTTLQQAIINLDETTFQIAIVVTSDGVLVGTITDGDIRRGLLQGMGMGSLIDDIVFHDPFVVPPQMDRETVFQLMRANKVRQAPVVDEKRRVVGLHLQDDLIDSRGRSKLMVIMAGGQGTRLRPYTEDCPKPLLEVGDKPILEHIILAAKADGFTHFVLAIEYLGDMIVNYFSDGRRWNVNIEYVREGSPLGTAGAIGMLSARPVAPFVVVNGDVLTDIGYREMLDFHCRYDASATMAVRMHEWQNPFGVVRTKGVDIISFEEKPIVRNHINAGVYVLNPDVLDFLKPDEYCDMPILFRRLQDSAMRTIVYPIHEPWLDVGRECDLDQAQAKHS